MHILLIEDHEKLAKNMEEYLKLERYAVSVVHNGTKGYETAMTGEFDLLILDINLPGLDGFSLCANLRKEGKNMPILMLTARDSQKEIIHGLTIGADDYLTKPFDMEELLARIRALLRRKSVERSPLLSFGAITLNTNTREVEKDGTTINLSPKEFALLEFLLQKKGIVQDRPTIIEHVWGRRDDLMFSQTVDVHIAYLRRKLGKDVITTVPGKGYLVPADS